MTLTNALWIAAAWPEGAVAAGLDGVAAGDDAAASAPVPWAAAGLEAVHAVRPSVTALASMTTPARVARPADTGGRRRGRVSMTSIPIHPVHVRGLAATYAGWLLPPRRPAKHGAIR
jgi:hypothetical protein